MKNGIRLNSKNNHTVKMLEDYYRIFYDLDMIQAMCKKGLKEENTFISYQGIIITYRKCFDSSSKGRSKSLTNKHLKGLTDHQQLLHKEILTIGNEYVAHFETKTYEFDIVIMTLILNENNKAVSIDVKHDLRQPVDKFTYKELLNIIKIIKKNLTESIIACTNNIVREYNAHL